MAGEVLLGHLQKAYYDADGVGGSSWSEIGQAADIRVNKDNNRVEIHERGVSVVLEKLGRTKVEVTMTLTVRPGATFYEAMRTAALAKTSVGFAFASANIATNGTKAWQGDLLIVGWPENGAMEGAKPSTYCSCLMQTRHQNRNT
ncbi:MAG: hypothetical protein R3B90_21725 [Planctomycetaceae bacterium]